MEHVIDHQVDVLFLSETWLTSKKNTTTAMFEEYGYVLHHNMRKDKCFNIYVRHFYTYVHTLAFEVEGYADGHQLFKQFVPAVQTNVLGATINECLLQYRDG